MSNDNNFFRLSISTDGIPSTIHNHAFHQNMAFKASQLAGAK